MDKKLINPCTICLVRPCCTDICSLILNHMKHVLEVVSKDPNHVVLEQFSEQQVKQILSYAKTYKINQEWKNEHSEEDPAM